METIDCEALLTQCYAMLNKAYEESYGRRYDKPEFRFVLSHDEIMALRKYVGRLRYTSYVYLTEKGHQTLFGQELWEQRKTPYIEAIIGETK